MVIRHPRTTQRLSAQDMLDIVNNSVFYEKKYYRIPINAYKLGTKNYITYQQLVQLYLYAEKRYKKYGYS